MFSGHQIGRNHGHVQVFHVNEGIIMVLICGRMPTGVIEIRRQVRIIVKKDGPGKVIQVLQIIACTERPSEIVVFAFLDNIQRRHGLFGANAVRPMISHMQGRQENPQNGHVNVSQQACGVGEIEGS